MCLYTCSPTPTISKRNGWLKGRVSLCPTIRLIIEQRIPFTLLSLIQWKSRNENRKHMGKPSIQETSTFPNQLNISKSCPKAVPIIPSDHSLANGNVSWISLYRETTVGMLIVLPSLIHYNKLFTFSQAYVCVRSCMHPI